MIEPSSKLQEIFDNAAVVAKSHNHEFITIEHLMFSILNDDETYTLLSDGFGADSEFIKTNLDHYLKNNLKDIVTNKQCRTCS